MVSIFDVPKPIRSWLSSDKVADELDKMNGWLGIGSENATLIADLLAKLELKEVTIDGLNADLKKQLAPLVGEEKTQLAIQDINKKLLNPIKNDLISFGIIPPETTYRPSGETVEIQAQKQPLAETPKFALKTSSFTNQRFSTDRGPEPEPYILHRILPKPPVEKESTQVEARPEQPVQDPRRIDERAQLFSPRFSDSGEERHFETPRQTRVVNYSQFRTPVDKPEKEPPLIHPQNVLDLKKNGVEKDRQTGVNGENTINLKDLPIE